MSSHLYQKKSNCLKIYIKNEMYSMYNLGTFTQKIAVILNKNNLQFYYSFNLLYFCNPKKRI